MKMYYTGEKGPGCEVDIEFEPEEHETPEEAAKGLYKAIVKSLSEKEEFDDYPMDEMKLWSPERTKRYSGIEAWSIVWEGGLYEWGIGTSMVAHGKGWWTEPYYSFDMHFYPR